MTFLFVCLVGDDHTAEAARFAERLANRLSSDTVIRDKYPPYEQITRMITEVSAPAHILIFGHNGAGSLRAQPLTDTPLRHWGTPQQLASMFNGLRVYAFACDTMGSRHSEDFDALGNECVRLGIQKFLGHCCVVSASIEEHSEEVVDAFAQMLTAYFGGENDSNRLRAIALNSFDALDALSVSVGKPYEVTIALRSAVRGLRVA